jgi:2-polyprenyl-3-methyl-5-hydroxy-6-metoxy-1,4-benzoquinol methylase
MTNADEKDRERWNRKYAPAEYLLGKAPIAFLRQYVDLLPPGKALDIAMGEGRNGVYLATLGYHVLGIDISDTGLRKAQELARELGTTIETQVVDLENARLATNEYDVIIVSYYLQRDLFPRIKKALKRGGMVVVETYNENHARYKPSFPKEYLLKNDELLTVFKDFVIIRYQAVDDGSSKAYASILARKP